MLIFCNVNNIWIFHVCFYAKKANITFTCINLPLFLLAIYKTRNTRTGNGMRGTRGMFTRVPGNLLEDSGECYYFNIPGTVEEDSGECSRWFRGMFKKIPGNTGQLYRFLNCNGEKMFRRNQEDSGKCSRRFQRMFGKIAGNDSDHTFSLTFLFTFTILLKFKSLNIASPFATNCNPGNFLLLAIILLPRLCALVVYFSTKQNRLLYLHVLIHMWCFD